MPYNPKSKNNLTRAGQGRPKTDRVKKHISVSPKTAKWLDSQPKQGEAIDHLLNEAKMQAKTDWYAELTERIASAPTEDLISLDYLKKIFPSVGHQLLPDRSSKQSSMDADLLRFVIQLELDRRKAGELPHSWGEMYLVLGIPKEFLDK